MTAAASERGHRHAELEARLGYRFADPALLEEALTHASAVNSRHRSRRNNEQMEFLGDRVLGLAVATILHRRHSREAVGALARRHSSLVRLETLADIAAQLGLDAEIRLSPGEEDAGGRHKPSLLADVCEAVIAAIYLDGGFESALDFVRRFWGPLVDEGPECVKDAKTALQEWTQALSLALPVYSLVETSGPAHAPVFTVEVAVVGLGPAVGSGSSKRKAEQVAAERLLTRLRAADSSDSET